MPRPKRCRRVCSQPSFDRFEPCGCKSSEIVSLTVDEYEVIRLVDFQKKTHEECSKAMDISRTTVTELYENARFKVSDSLVNGKTLEIKGGNYRLCTGDNPCCDDCHCHKAESEKSEFIIKGDCTMRIAVTYENGDVFQHFGHTEQFKVYDVVDGVIKEEHIVDTNGQGHGALASFLFSGGVDVLICGGIGGGAQSALAQAGIKLYGGVSGKADDAVKSFLDGSLEYNPNVMCNHHGEGHTCGGHHEDGHSCGGHHENHECHCHG